MLGQCLADVVDDGPLLTQHLANASCLLGIGTTPMRPTAMRAYLVN